MDLHSFLYYHSFFALVSLVGIFRDYSLSYFIILPPRLIARVAVLLASDLIRSTLDCRQLSFVKTSKHCTITSSRSITSPVRYLSAFDFITACGVLIQGMGMDNHIVCTRQPCTSLYHTALPSYQQIQKNHFSLAVASQIYSA